MDNFDVVKQKFGYNVVDYCMSYMVFRIFLSCEMNEKFVSKLNIVYICI